MLDELADAIRRRESEGMILEGKRVLVTGGTGSMGKKLVRRLLSGEIGTPAKVIILSRDEAKQHVMRLAYMNRKATTDEVIYENFQRIISVPHRGRAQLRRTCAERCATPTW